MPDTRLDPISATAISHYVRLAKCDRYLRFRMRRDEVNAMIEHLQALDVIEQPLTPLLRDAGLQFESEVVNSLPGTTTNLQGKDASATIHAIEALRPGGSCFLVQAAVEGEIGGWPCVGRADLVRAMRLTDGCVDLLVADIKASRKDRVEHRLQVAFYIRLLSDMLEGAGVRVGERAGAVLKVGEGDILPQIDDPANGFDLEPYVITLSQIMEGEGSDLARVVRAEFGSLDYSLGYKCDSCIFNQLCMADSSERQDVALTPFIQPSEVSTLRAVGVKTVRDLAALKVLPGPTDWNTEFAPAPSKEELVASLKTVQPLGPRLDRLVQRALAIGKQYDPGVEAYSHLLDGTFSQLPSDETNPDLVKVFIDAQHDYVQDRIYLAGALVQGPTGSVPLVRMSPGPPTAADEENIVVGLLREILEAVPAVARDPEVAPLHLYIFDGYNQKVWLEALGRHLEAVSAVPAFYDLLTASPALGQPMVSSLAAEVRERRNLGITCQNLYSVASRLGFKWSTPRDEFGRLFYLRVFDGRKQRADGQWVEKASRFNSHIPLEYAYGAWGELPEDPSNRALIAYFRRCAPGNVARFQVHRLRALAHIEGALKGKNKLLIKEPVPLAALGKEPSPVEGLARSLSEFLWMEHHAAAQERLALYALPIERRAQTGRALLLTCTGVEKPSRDLIASFLIDFKGVGLDPMASAHSLRIKEGDWMVLNPHDGRSPWRVVNGRIAIVERIEGQEINLRLMGLSNRGSEFKYTHNSSLKPEPGERYTLDEMSDDLNSDKQMDAVCNANDNVFYGWLTAAPVPAAPMPVTGRTRQFMDRVYAIEGRHGPTHKQEEVIAGHIVTPLLCVQGPPGTGKTVTLGWAALARLFVMDERPLRVAVCARTHKATNLILASIAGRLRAFGQTPEGRALGRVAIYKVAADGGDDLPRGVRALNPYGPLAAITEVFEAPVAVIGGTPGGIYSLINKRSGRSINWSEKLFDLVIIDEASQMSLPEAILAGAFLKPSGQMLVVGDHRQMPPILSHPWQDERKRTAVAHRPHRSVFEALVGAGFPTVGLDESFRLHKVQAEFLARNIYLRDGISLYSRRIDMLPPLPEGADEYVAAALRRDYPVVVIEHNEVGSQQYNQVEIELATPIIAACLNDLHLDAVEGIGVVVPHRAQRAALRRSFPVLAQADAIDTVERFQGGERDVIIVSATASDPNYVLSEAGFLMNLNRLNVAISRPRLKLIVIASKVIFRMVTDDLGLFDNAVLWKQLRYKHAIELLWQGERGNHNVSVLGRHGGNAAPLGAPSILRPKLVLTPVQPPAPTQPRRERIKEKW